MGSGQRQFGECIAFERGYDAHIMAIDGTWRRACNLLNVSETSAKLIVSASVEGLHITEFFLLLSSPGLAYRRCELASVNGQEIGVTFLKNGKQKRPAKAPDSP